ncbi:TRAP transporter small permease [Pseudochrobactrum sp. sp1633]|uniref:TRAP transporter small permease n=1 Tax=Pseudochrobactrum sp. sp1633 TaxID=3036706 RepID=UPI0025A5E8CF|nr:TRAP transporter small permease [Pseudochrobactrum sp. sp1633]MDM8347178.1 TRAP transporter small permease [Pseudochrobactrum sp. sp1633]
MRNLQFAGRTLAMIGAYMSALILGTMVILMVLEMFLRGLFSSSIHIVEDLVGYGTAAVLFLSLAYTFISSGHIRVNIILEKLNSSGQRLLEIICTLATSFVVILITWYSARKMLLNFERNVTSTGMYEIPLWIPGAVIVAGLLMLLIVLLIHLFACITGSAAIVSHEQHLQGE